VELVHARKKGKPLKNDVGKNRCDKNGKKGIERKKKKKKKSLRTKSVWGGAPGRALGANGLMRGSQKALFAKGKGGDFLRTQICMTKGVGGRGKGTGSLLEGRKVAMKIKGGGGVNMLGKILYWERAIFKRKKVIKYYGGEGGKSIQ